MKKLIIIGAGGFAREVAWLVERINARSREWELLGFVDDNPATWGETINGYKVLCGTDGLVDHGDVYAVCAIGSAKTRKKVIEKIKSNAPAVKFATLTDPSVIISDLVSIGEGCIICANTVVTVNVKIGAHVHVNLDCTVGHDAEISDYVTVYPGVNISGMTFYGECVELGTGAQIIQGKKIGKNTVIGAGAVVVRDIPESCTAVGNPARVIKTRD